MSELSLFVTREREREKIAGTARHFRLAGALAFDSDLAGPSAPFDSLSLYFSRSLSLSRLVRVSQGVSEGLTRGEPGIAQRKLEKDRERGRERDRQAQREKERQRDMRDA
jgi:hypothetical protein